MNHNLKTLKAAIEDYIDFESEPAFEKLQLELDGFEKELRLLLRTKHTDADFDFYKNKLITEILGENHE